MCFLQDFSSFDENCYFFNCFSVLSSTTCFQDLFSSYLLCLFFKFVYDDFQRSISALRTIPENLTELLLTSLHLLRFLLRKEVIHPHVPVGIPCYDLTPVIGPAFDGSLLKGYATGFGRCRLPWFDGRCVQGPGTYSPRHADPRLLAIPTSWSRVADSNPNWDGFFEIRSASLPRCPLLPPL